MGKGQIDDLAFPWSLLSIQGYDLRIQSCTTHPEPRPVLTFHQVYPLALCGPPEIVPVVPAGSVATMPLPVPAPERIFRTSVTVKGSPALKAAPVEDVATSQS
jgi:hypothetical protein